MTDTNDQPQSAVATVPPVHPENEGAWAAIEASDLGDRMKRALRRVAAGESFREAAKAEQYGTHSDVYRHAKRFGLMDVKSGELIEGCRRVARMGVDELERRLVDDAEGLSMKELGVTTGIMLDKIAKKERWGVEPSGSGGAIARLEQIAASIADQRLRLDVSLGPSDSAQPAIDVTPTE